MSVMRRVWWCFGLFWFSFHQGRSQNDEIFALIDQSRGLSNGSVTGIVQDSLGFIWIATKNGINKYDGNTFTLYTTRNSSLKANDITSVFKDNQNRLWFGTLGGGVSIYDYRTDHFVTFFNDVTAPAAIPSNHIQCIYQDSRGVIWMGSDRGLIRYNPQDTTFSSFVAEKGNPYSLSNNHVQSIFDDGSGGLWVGTFGGGLNYFDPGKEIFTHFRTSEKEDVDADFIHVISAVSPGSLLLGTNESGLLEFDVASGQFRGFLDDPYSSIRIVRTMIKDEQGDLWIGTDGDGVLHITDPLQHLKVAQYLNKPSVPTSLVSNAVYALYQDSQENIWIGTAWNGINVLKNNRNRISFYYSDFQGVEKSGVLSIWEDDQAIWLGTDGDGVSRYVPSKDQVVYYNRKKGSGIGGDYIHLMELDPGGKYLWMGTFKSGLLRYDLLTGKVNKWQHDIAVPNSLSHNDVRDILRLDDDRYLIATWGGGLNLLNIRTGQYRFYTHDLNDPQSIGSDNVISMEPAGNGRVWVATFGGGLNLFDPSTEHFIRFQHDEQDPFSISGNNVLCLLKDEEANLWIGTWGSGLNYFDIKSQRFSRFDTDKGLIDNTVTALLQDRNNNIWLSTKQGVVKFDLSDSTFREFAELAGEYHIRSAFANSNGRLYFGHTKGVISFVPEELEKRRRSPTALITGLQVFNNPVEVRGEILPLQLPLMKQLVLDYDQNVITFDFSAIELPFADCEYAVQLEGVHDDWLDLGKQRSATFSNLLPGQYRLKVRSRVHRGEWSEEFASIAITILNPWWKMWWAYVLYLGVFILLLYLFQRYVRQWEGMKNKLKLEVLHREKETELHNLKQSFFTNISHEIRTPVTLMLGSLHKMEQQGVMDKKQEESLAIVRRNGNHLLHLTNELLDFRKLETEGIKLKVAEGNLVKFAKEVFLSFSGQASKNQIAYRFFSDTDDLRAWYDRDQMEKVLYNLLANAFKYTPAGGSIQLNVYRDDENVFMKVSDTGKGIPEGQLKNIFKRFYQSDNVLEIKESGFGLGLSIAEEIVKLHAGEIHAESKINAGTTITIKLTPGNNHFRNDELLTDFRDSEEISNYVPGPDEELTTRDRQQEYQVLVVDDNEGIRNYLRDILIGEYEVLEAANGVEALDVIEKNLPDMVISDVMMPVMDGITLTRQLKSTKKTSHIPVIILTARTSLIYKREGYETGADEYITKPFNEVLLRARVRGIFKNRETLREKFQNEIITQPKDLALNTPDQQFLEDLIGVIENNFDQNELNAELITRELGMSHSVVYKKIKALTGLSLVEFVRDFKLKRAAMLISRYQFSVSEACYRVGFSDRKYFSQIFKKKFGMTPSDYARLNTN